MTTQAALPFAILKPKKVKGRPELYKSYLEPSPLSATNQSLLHQLRPFLSGKPVVIDLETEGLNPHGTEGKNKRVLCVSLANDQAVCSWHLQGDRGQQVWRQILGILHKKQIPLIAHNLVFDLAWMLRDLNKDEHGEIPQWIDSNFKFLKLEACTYGLFRQLASEGFPGQKYNLGYAQKNLLGWEDSNKTERQRRLFEAGLIYKLPSKALLTKLMGEEQATLYAERFLNSRIREKEEDSDEPETDA